MESLSANVLAPDPVAAAAAATEATSSPAMAAAASSAVVRTLMAEWVAEATLSSVMAVVAARAWPLDPAVEQMPQRSLVPS